MNPDISVIIPTFRRPKLLAEAIESVLAQGGVETEIIVVDDSPEKSAEDVVKGFSAASVRYIHNPAPSGGRPALVRNIGWQQAQGELVHFLDDDDRVPAGYYKAARNAFAAHPGIGVVFGRIDPFGDVDLSRERRYFTAASRRARRLAHLGSIWGFTAAELFGETLLVCGGAMIRRNCIAPLGGFDARMPLAEDVDFYARAIRSFGACFLDQTALYYRIGPSLMHREGIEKDLLDSFRMMHARYRSQWGTLDFLLLKLFSRLIGA